MTEQQLRIVSLIPSATEIVVSLGLGDQLVGRSMNATFRQRAGSAGMYRT